MWKTRRPLLGVLGLLVSSLMVWGPVLAAEGDRTLLAYRGHPTALTYTLTVKTSLKTLTHEGGDWRGTAVKKSHEDILGLGLEAKEGLDGLIDQTLTFTSINGKTSALGLSPGAREGDVPILWLKREEIVGKAQEIRMDLLGRVKDATGVPHFVSPGFHNRTSDGPPLDMYRVLLTMFPQFSLKRVSPGEQWTVKDEAIVRDAKETPQGGPLDSTRSHKLEAKVKRDITYIHQGFVERGGYRTAVIGITGSYTIDAKGVEPNNGHYVKGNGKLSGEYYFAPTEGLVVEAALKSKLNQSYTFDGLLVGYWMTPKERVSLILEDSTMPVVPWEGEQTIRLELAGSRAAAR